MDDKLEGKAKQAEGKLTGDADREAEGKGQEAVGDAKNAASNAADAAEKKLKED